MRRKALCAIAAVCTVAGAALMGLVAPASAQPYPPGACTANSASFAGEFAVGSTITLTLAADCVWDPGTGVDVTVNGTSVGTKTADSGGAVSVAITIVSETELSVDDPIQTSARCGANTVRGVGTSRAAGGSASHTTTFDIACPGAAARPSKGKVALTGANVVRWSSIALGLVVVGGLFLAIDRRRARAGD